MLCVTAIAQVADVEAAEEAALSGNVPQEEKDQEVKPFIHK